MIVLRKQSHGTAVLILQHMLNIELFPSTKLKIDGQFGKNTFNAVIPVQLQHHLKTDGIVGKNTWKALGFNNTNFPELNKPVSSLTPWLAIALAEKGVRENKNQGKHNKRIIKYHAATSLKAKADETAWCSSFVNWVMVQSGRKGTNNALAKSWLKWGRKLDKPRNGAITIIKDKRNKNDTKSGVASGYHVAFFVRQSKNYITLFGGNQQSRVREMTYRLSRFDVKGYRWPTSN